MIEHPDLDGRREDVRVRRDPDGIVYTWKHGDDENQLPLPDDPARWWLSGHGQRSNWKSCGSFKDAFKIDGTNRFVSSRWSCHSQGCPDCFRGWARDRAEKAAAFMAAVGAKFRMKWYHYFLHPSKEWVDRDPKDGKPMFDRMVKAFLALAKEFHDPSRGELSWMYVRHPRSIKCNVDGHAPGDHAQLDSCPAHDGSPDWGWWFDPHVHLVTNFWIPRDRIDEYNAREKELGVIAGNITVIKERSPMNRQELQATIAYELGHAWYVPATGSGKGMKALNWGGFLSRRALFRWDTKVIVEWTSQDGRSATKHEARQLGAITYKVKVPYEPKLSPVWVWDDFEANLGHYEWKQVKKTRVSWVSIVSLRVDMDAPMQQEAMRRYDARLKARLRKANKERHRDAKQDPWKLFPREAKLRQEIIEDYVYGHT